MIKPQLKGKDALSLILAELRDMQHSPSSANDTLRWSRPGRGGPTTHLLMT